MDTFGDRAMNNPTSRFAEVPAVRVFAGVGRLLKSHTAHRPSSRASGLEEY